MYSASFQISSDVATAAAGAAISQTISQQVANAMRQQQKLAQAQAMGHSGLTYRKYLYGDVWFYMGNYSDRPTGFYHDCGRDGGIYRIAKAGQCYKCRKQIAPYENLMMAMKLKELKNG